MQSGGSILIINFKEGFKLHENFVVRQAKTDDDDFFRLLYSASREDMQCLAPGSDFVANLIAMQYRAQCQAYSQNYPDAIYFVVEKSGEKVGRIIVNFDHERVHLIDINILPEERGKGCGTAVIKALQDTARHADIPLTLSVYHDNPGARRLYLSLEFEGEGADAVMENMVWSHR